MDDAVNLGVLGEDLVESGLVCDVGLVELWSLAADELDAVQGHLGGVVEVIDNHDLVAVLEQGEGCEGSNVTGTTANPESAIVGVFYSHRFASLRTASHRIAPHHPDRLCAWRVERDNVYGSNPRRKEVSKLTR